jgi:DNA gyrase inhibitor GyrI
MSDFEVKIVELPAMRVASFFRYSETPEIDAITDANTWLKSRGLYKKDAYRHFGFNNPGPSPGSSKYGYEIWILPEGGLPEDEEVETKDFPGGLYAVGTCDSVNSIGEDWQRLFAWRDASSYQWGNHQGLEEVLNPPVEIKDLRFLLYLPISN